MKISSLFACLALCLALSLAACHPKTTSGGGTTAVDSVKTDKPDGGTTAVDTTTDVPTGGVKPPRPPAAVELQFNLVTQYERGEVEQCMYKGMTIYRCSRNAPDAGSEIYDVYGQRIARCYANTGIMDPACKDATDCKVIYRMANNIWGKPAVPWVKPD